MTRPNLPVASCKSRGSSTLALRTSNDKRASLRWNSNTAPCHRQRDRQTRNPARVFAQTSVCEKVICRARPGVKASRCQQICRCGVLTTDPRRQTKFSQTLVYEIRRAGALCSGDEHQIVLLSGYSEARPSGPIKARERTAATRDEHFFLFLAGRGTITAAACAAKASRGSSSPSRARPLVPLRFRALSVPPTPTNFCRELPA